MADLKTKCMGLDLDSPVIVGSSGLTRDVEGVKQCADAGAGAVVLKSIFEEQIRDDFAAFDSSMQDSTYHPEAYEYFRADLASRYGAHEYCKFIRAARDAVSIPVIASINCFSNSAWNGFAAEIEEAGADALELNVSFPPLSRLYASANDHMNSISDTVHQICSTVKIPVSVKLPPSGIYVGALASQSAKAGANGLVFFNRFFVPDVDIQALEMVQTVNYSEPGETAASRRYIALLSKSIGRDLIASTGIHSAEDVIVMLLVGACAVEVVSAAYVKGFGVIQDIKSGISSWMDEKGFSSINDFRGRLAAEPGDAASPFGRFQYIRSLTESVPDSPTA